MTEISDGRANMVPSWTAPAYLATALVCLVAYLFIDAYYTTLPGAGVVKALGIVMLGFYALVRGAPVLMLALMLSAGGDFALAMRPPQLEAGIGFFGAAHLVYLSIFIAWIMREGWRRDGLLLAAALVAWGLAMLWWLRPGMGDLALAASVYNGIILAMAIAAGFVKGPRLIVIGALLFVISDSLLAAGWFRDVRPLDWANPVWITYGAAQVCLAIGISAKAGGRRSPDS